MEEKRNKRKAKCLLCEQFMEGGEGVFYKNSRYAHPACIEKRDSTPEAMAEADRVEFLGYLKEKQLLTEPVQYQRISRQRKNFIAKYGWSDKEMLLAMKYWHEVVSPKFNPKYQGSIIILPNIMEEALLHWKQEEKKEKVRIEKAKIVGGPEERIVVVGAPTPRLRKDPREVDPNAPLE